MKKVTIELPEWTQCAFVNYVYLNEGTAETLMATRSISTDEINKGYSPIKNPKEAD